MSKAERLKWIEKQMEIQQNAIIIAKTINDINIHSYLLNKLTDEWCKLIKSEN